MSILSLIKIWYLQIYLAKNDYSLDLKSIPHYIKSVSYESTPPNCIKSVSYESTEKHSIFAPNDNIAEMVKNRGSTQKPPGTFFKITTTSSKLTRHIGWPLFTLTKLVPMSYTIKNKCIPGLVATCMTKHGIYFSVVIRFRRPSVFRNYKIQKEVIQLHVLKAYL